MKQIIIFLLLVVIGIMGYNAYSRYKRYNPPQSQYSTDAKIDLNYHDPQVVTDYYRAVERLNGYVAQQWSFNRIDVRAPKNDNEETKASVAVYNDLLADVSRLEAILSGSAELKEKGMSNREIMAMENGGIVKREPNTKEAMLRKWLDSNPGDFDFGVGSQGPLVYEIQSLLIDMGHEITHDGIFRLETATAVEAFENAQGLFADGRMDPLTANALLKN